MCIKELYMAFLLVVSDRTHLIIEVISTHLPFSVGTPQKALLPRLVKVFLAKGQIILA